MKLKKILKVVLSPKKLESIYKKQLERKFDMEIDISLIHEGPGYWNVDVPVNTLKKDWNEFFEKHGYYIADKDTPPEFNNPPPVGYVRYKLFPFKTDEVDVENTLYHVTPKNKLLKIKKKGLVPKKSKKWFKVNEPRVYLITNEDKVSLMKKDLKPHISENPPFGDSLAVLEVEPSQVLGDFYKDNEVVDSVYTRSNIPPKAIKNWNDYESELKTLRKNN